MTNTLRHRLRFAITTTFTLGFATVFSGCSVGTPPQVAPAPEVEAVALDDTHSYETTSADEFPPALLVEEFSAAGDTLFDEYVYEDTTSINIDRIFSRAWDRQQAAQDYIRQARAQIDTALALLDTIPEHRADSVVLATRDELIIELSRLVRQLVMAENRDGLSRAGEIPIELNEFVEREIRSFQGPERSFFLASYARSGAYVPLMKRKLREAGMPEELVWLAFIESGFKTSALSRARALGPWQFIASTGNRYGLSRDRWTDERRDFERATDGAIAYLRDLHAMFGDWNTALAGYNSGENRVLRIINRQRADYLDQFWDLYIQLPQETRRYVPRFHAVLNILQDPEKWGFHDLPEPAQPVSFDTITTDREMALKDIAATIGVSESELEFLNPSLRHKITPSYEYTIRVPKGTAEAASAALASVPVSKLPDVPEFVVHTVRRGETLSTIAVRYRTSVRAIQNANNMRGTMIRIGQRLRVPVANPSFYTSRVTQNAQTTPEGSTVHVVRQGDTLWQIAQAYGTTVTQIRRLNGMGTSSRIYPGQRLIVKN